MYFHLIGIKEKEDKKYELDLLISWWDEDFVKDFLSHRWVVIVSIGSFKEDPATFWDISVSVPFKNNEIQIILKWDDLSERVYFICFLWLKPTSANSAKNPISEQDMNQLIEDTLKKIELLNKEIEQKKEEEIQKEQKKYEEHAINDWLKIINNNISHLEQVIKAWEGIIETSEKVKLELCLNEMKKIRLWTNFNKMTLMVLESHKLAEAAEQKILQAYDSQKFLIDKNSVVTNVDVIYENWFYNKISETATLIPQKLKPIESIIGLLWSPGILLQLLKRDLIYTFQQTTFADFFRVLMNVCEYFVLTWILSITILWVISPLIGFQDFSLRLLPTFWWLWLLIYLFNTLNLKKPISMIAGFIVLAVIYWRGISLLLNTFAM